MDREISLYTSKNDDNAEAIKLLEEAGIEFNRRTLPPMVAGPALQIGNDRNGRIYGLGEIKKWVNSHNEAAVT